MFALKLLFLMIYQKKINLIELERCETNFRNGTSDDFEDFVKNQNSFRKK